MDQINQPAPEVSVIIPVRNGEKYLAQALESVLIQEVPLEVIVIDDGSTDGTLSVLEPYLKRPDFLLLKNPVSLGVAASRNEGVRQARGRYVAFLDADDWWAAGKLDRQLTVLNKTGYVLCSTGRELMNPDGTSTGKYIPVYEEITYEKLLRHNAINCSSVVIRREAALEFPMEHEDSHEDYISWLGVLKKYRHAVGINEPLLKYRLSEGSKSRNKGRSALMTYRAYRYAGLSVPKSIRCFISYALHGIWKYR